MSSRGQPPLSGFFPLLAAFFFFASSSSSRFAPNPSGKAVHMHRPPPYKAPSTMPLGRLLSSSFRFPFFFLTRRRENKVRGCYLVFFFCFSLSWPSPNPPPPFFWEGTPPPPPPHLFFSGPRPYLPSPPLFFPRELTAETNCEVRQTTPRFNNPGRFFLRLRVAQSPPLFFFSRRTVLFFRVPASTLLLFLLLLC